MNFLKKINWINVSFILLLTPIVGIGGLIYLIHTGDMRLATWIMAFCLLCAGGFSITVGYHRLFSHRSYKAAWPVRFLLALFGAATFQGSILEWCTDHRNHHLYTDTEKDPYSISEGFWYAHMGWLFTLDGSKRDYSNVEELAKDPIIKYQHKFYVPIAIIMGFGLPMLLGSLWGDMWGGLILGGFLRIVLNHHTTFAINSVCHVFGERKYSDKQTARDNWITAFFTFGEGYHNFHHQFPLDYRNGIRFYQYDPTKWIIRSLSYVGLASGLKRVDEQRILRYRLLKQEADIMKKISRYSEQFMTQVNEFVKPVYNQILEQIEHINELKESYKQLQQGQIKAMKGKMDDYRVQLKAHKLKLKLAQVELKKNLSKWQSLVRADQGALVSLSQMA
ncbi:MAG: fatty acid desaturase [Coxiella sp. (in: Bacteria)]|nr:MAG: fatty acid desaturase [Coxiella sp. (in: g-proteobacteria)]